MSLRIRKYLSESKVTIKKVQKGEKPSWGGIGMGWSSHPAGYGIFVGGDMVGIINSMGAGYMETAEWEVTYHKRVGDKVHYIPIRWPAVGKWRGLKFAKAFAKAYFSAPKSKWGQPWTKVVDEKDLPPIK